MNAMPESRKPPAGARALREAVAGVPAWYHSIELAPGVVTPGYFDLRPIVGSLPWPDVRGKRCLDIGSYDGFYAFELERRGAAEVVAVDVADAREWDWPPDAREPGLANVARFAGPRHAPGFDVAKEALGSSVEKTNLTIYELTPERLGTFDVVVCGSLLLHLRDPIRALEAVRSVCGWTFLSVDEVRLALSYVHRRRALAELNGSGERMQWWVPNVAGHRRMLYAAGFSVERSHGPFAVPFGPSHPTATHKPRDARSVRTRLLQRALTGGIGVPHHAVLATPRL